jgi:uncharacterized protein
VIDKAEIFSAAEEEQLLASISEVQRNHNGVICLYTVAALAGKSVYDYSIETANSLGVGQKGLNNGMLLFIAPNDRKVQLLVGSGLEWAVPDEANKAIISAILPSYGKRQFLKGSLEGIRLLKEKLGTVHVSVKDIAWQDLLAAPDTFAGGVVRFRYPGNAKLSNCLQPEPEHAQFDKRFNLKIEQGKHVLYLRYTKYMGEYIDPLCGNQPLTIVARVDKSNPQELKLMGVLKGE